MYYTKEEQAIAKRILETDTLEEAQSANCNGFDSPAMFLSELMRKRYILDYECHSLLFGAIEIITKERL